MCARFYRVEDWKALYTRFMVQQILSTLEPQYNIAPAEQALAIPATDGPRQAVLMKFGLANPWREGAGLLLNMRAESFVNKPAFKRYLERQRCLVPADGFYEWRKTKAGSLPYGYSIKGGGLFGFAGIYDQDCFAIITTEANAIVREVHDRMPVILRRSEEDLWLDSKVTEYSKLIPLLAPYPSAELTAAELSQAVNSARNKGPEVLRPLKP
jgi:putative SOS response-associated peptidase YedK